MACSVMLVVALLMPATGHLQAAQTPTWQAIGPLERDVTAAALASGLWYVSIRGSGTYLSRDGGATWLHALAGLPAVAADWIGIDPYSAQRALVLVEGVPFTTSDGGRHWHRSVAGLPATPGLSTGLYSTTQLGVIFAGGATGLFVSHDDGAHWQPAGNGIPAGRRVTFVAASLQQPRLLLTGTSYLEAHGGVLYLSTDGGRTWQQAFRGLPPSVLPWQGFWSLTGTQTAWVAAGSLYRTTDRGEQWHQDAAGLPPHAFIEVLAQLQDGTQFVQSSKGLYTRAPHSAVWQRVETPWPASLPVHQLIALPGRRLLVLTAAGMYLDDGTGSHWQAVGAGLPGETAVQALAIDAQHGTIFVGGLDGVWRLSPPSDLWRQSGPGLPADPNVHALLALPAPHAALLSGTDYGIYVNSTGTRWVPAKGPLEERPVATLAYAPQAQRVYAGLSAGGLFTAPVGTLNWQSVEGAAAVSADTLLLVDPTGSWILANGHLSRDGGRTWHAVAVPAVRTGALSTLTGTPFTVVLGTAGHGVYRSFDGGRHWQQDSAIPRTATVSQLLGVQDTLLAIANGRVLQGTFSGDRWMVLGSAPTGESVTAIQVLSGTRMRIAAGTAMAGVYLWHAPLAALRVATITPLVLPSQTPTATVEILLAPTGTPTGTSTPSLSTPSATATGTPTAPIGPTLTGTASPTLTSSPSASPSPTATPVPSLVPFSTPTPLPTVQPTATLLGALVLVDSGEGGPAV